MSLQQYIKPFVSFKGNLFHPLLCFLLVRLELFTLLEELFLFLKKVRRRLLQGAVDGAQVEFLYLFEGLLAFLLEVLHLFFAVLELFVELLNLLAERCVFLGEDKV
jgi:hypothetical protein